MEIPQQPAYQPPVTPQPVMPQPMNKGWVIPLVIVLVLAGGYFAFAKYQSMWPFSPQVAMESPTPSPTISTSVLPSISQSPVNQWTTFNSKYFNLSFKIPAGFDVSDSQNYIAVSKGKLQTSAIGSNNAFLSIERFDQNNTRDKAIAYARQLLKNQKESTVTIDGSQFLKIEGDDYGRYEGDSAGKIIQIFFEKSVLLVQERPGNQTQNFDVIALANQIIPTIKFSSTANWKTYTNTQYGFSFKYPNILTEKNMQFLPPNNQGGTMVAKIIQGALDKNSIQGIYGTVEQNRLTEVSIGGKTAYYFNDGDAGCGGPDYRIPLNSQNHLSLRFVDCELQTPYISSNIPGILSSFRFIQ